VRASEPESAAVANMTTAVTTGSTEEHEREQSPDARVT
jgi:hypothetical protein